MNREQLKLNVEELQKKGYGYKRIAKELSITVSSARYICSKHSESKLDQEVCKHCGSKIKSIKGKKKKIFCSDKCRLEWWNNNQDKVNKKAYYTLTCKQCHKEFTTYGNSQRLYCSQECYLTSKKTSEVINDERG